MVKNSIGRNNQNQKKYTFNSYLELKAGNNWLVTGAKTAFIKTSRCQKLQVTKSAFKINGIF